MSDEVRGRLAGILAGDSAAAAWLYDTFAAQLFRRLRQRYGYLDREAVEDLLQDTFLLILRHDARLISQLLARDEGAALSPDAVARFLWDEACGLASNLRRAAAKRKVVELADYRDLASSADQGREVLDRDTLESLDRCLKAGAGRVYLYYTFRVYDGLAPEEISAATGWSKKATYKLRQALNEALEACARSIGLWS